MARRERREERPRDARHQRSVGRAQETNEDPFEGQRWLRSRGGYVFSENGRRELRGRFLKNFHRLVLIHPSLAEFEEASHRERDDLPDAADPVAPTRNVFWDFIPFENDAGREEATFCKPTRTQNHGGLRKTAPRGRGACVFDSQPRRVDAVDSEEEEEETLKKDRRGNPSPEIPTNSARRRASKGDAVKEKPKTLRLTTNVTSSRGQSTKALVNERISNTYPAEKGRNRKHLKKSISLLLPCSFHQPFLPMLLRTVPADVSTIT